MSLVGFRAKNHPQQATRDDVDDRRTPKPFFDALHVHYRFTLDVAASIENALLPRYYTRESDGLSLSWVGHRVWCNPPYSKIEPWLVKAWREMREGCEVAVMLLPANRCEQGWWHRNVETYRDGKSVWGGVRLQTSFLPGRLRFDWPGDRVVPAKGDRPPFGCVLLTWTRA